MDLRNIHIMTNMCTGSPVYVVVKVLTSTTKNSTAAATTTTDDLFTLLRGILSELPIEVGVKTASSPRVMTNR